MTITGLENNYYLAYNDVWVSVANFTEPVSVLEVTVKNLTNGALLPPFKMSASPSNDFEFNVSQIIRALFPEPNHTANNSMQNFQIDFTAKFTATETPDEKQTLIRFFVRGGRNKNINDEWFLTSGTELIVGRWLTWNGVTLPTSAQRIIGGAITSFTASNPYRIMRTKCDPIIVKFLNSIGGYQYFFFEAKEKSIKTKSSEIIDRTAYRLRDDNFRAIENDSETEFELTTKTPAEVQPVFDDLIQSMEVFIYNAAGEDDAAKWQRVRLEGNESIENNYDKVFNNSLKISIPNYKSVKL